MQKTLRMKTSLGEMKFDPQIPPKGYLSFEMFAPLSPLSCCLPPSVFLRPEPPNMQRGGSYWILWKCPHTSDVHLSLMNLSSWCICRSQRWIAAVSLPYWERVSSLAWIFPNDKPMIQGRTTSPERQSQMCATGTWSQVSLLPQKGLYPINHLSHF